MRLDIISVIITRFNESLHLNLRNSKSVKEIVSFSDKWRILLKQWPLAQINKQKCAFYLYINSIYLTDCKLENKGTKRGKVHIRMLNMRFFRSEKSDYHLEECWVSINFIYFILHYIIFNIILFIYFINFKQNKAIYSDIKVWPIV